MMVRLLQQADARLLKLTRSAILGLALLLAVAIGIADFYVAPDLLVLYLAPIFLAAWYGGPRPGYVVALYASAASFVTLTFVNGSHDFDRVAVGNLIVRLLAYMAIAHVVVRLRESRRQQEELIGFIIHDLRSPVSSAITGLLTVEQSGELSEGDREMIQLALVSNQRALTLVNSMLDVAKLENGNMEVRWDDVELEPFIDECWQHLALWALGQQVTLRKSLAIDHATLDRSLTSRVLANLLSNALKYSPNQSAITITVKPDHHGVRFTIEDAGPGIPPEYVESIFEPFSQVKGTQGGTGLGLTFCRLAVHAQGGRIGAKSQIGEGATFWFTIPGHSRTGDSIPVPAP